MNEFVIVEVGSTTTKAYLCKDEEIKSIGFKTIEFKKNFKQEQKINEEDKKKLFAFIADIKYKNIYVYGTSIFRKLDERAKESWLEEFKKATNLDFNIVSADLENEYTVYGAVSNVKYDKNIAVMIGGGGSTELSIVNNGKIIESINYDFGAGDVTDKFPDLMEDYAKTDYQEMVNYVKTLVKPPKNKADILILAGGDYIYFYEELKYNIAKNEFYDNPLQPYRIDIKTMDELDQDFFYNKSLEEIIKRTNDAGWWNGARGMRICVKTISDIVNASYIIPTRINMVYGIAEKIKNKL